jgi:hypothetical protein
MNQKDFAQHVSMLLRDLPIGTTADLSDFAVAWWNGRDVTYAFLRDDESGLSGASGERRFPSGRIRRNSVSARKLKAG